MKWLSVNPVLTEGNIETLFQAALIPGILAALGYILAIAVYVRLWPEEGPAGKRSSRAERIHGLVQIWPVLLIFIVVIGGIYAGLFTPTQGAAVGAAGTGLTAFVLGDMRLKGFVDSLLGTASAAAMIFLVLFGAGVLNSFLGYTGTPRLLASVISDSGVSPMLVLLIMIAVFVVLGCLMDSLSMILLLLPIFWPIILGLDFGMEVDDLRAWFCIIALIVVEVGLITPPVGLNVFIINSMADGVPMRDTFVGVAPFLITDAIRIALLIAIPGITLLLPHLLAR